MKTFLDSLLAKLVAYSDAELSRTVVVLPSRRAVVFLKNALAKHFYDRVVLLPQIISIDSFITDLSKVALLGNTEALFLLYEAYTSLEIEEKEHSFERFLGWGQTLLQDFNEIDRYLVDPDTFFNYLYDINDQKHWFLEEDKTDLIENYIEFWQKLYTYYQKYQELISARKMGYQGYQYRKAAEYAETFINQQDSHYLFAGFNALNNAEQHIIQTFLKANKATVFWDADKTFLEDKYHDASLFLKRFQKHWDIDTNGFQDSIHNSFAKDKEIDIIGVPGGVGQAKFLSTLLENMEQKEYSKTALVLADETLLLPVLNALPSKVQNVNITMGMPLSQSPISVFVNQLISLKFANKGKGYYYKDILQFLENPYTQVIVGKEHCNTIRQHIFDTNWGYLPTQILNEKLPKEITFRFKNWENTPKATTELKSFLEELLVHYQVHNNEIQITYCISMLEVVEQFTNVMTQYDETISGKTFLQLLMSEISSQTIDFRGEPFEGLQIMGVLESRCLDFEQVIMLGVNEGKLPSGSKTSSFIPFDLKSQFKLPTHKDKDAIYAYHFYRLLQRCEKAYLIYNTEVDSVKSGEKSRFLQQLELEPLVNHQIRSRIVSASQTAKYTPLTEITTTTEIQQVIKEKSQTGFSPSALATYLRDPMAFYEKYVLDIHEPDELEEEVAARSMGTIIHNVLEYFYKNYLPSNRILTVEVLNKMKADVVQVVKQEFRKKYADGIKSGINYLTQEATITYINKFLNAELDEVKKGHEIEIIALETKLKVPIKTHNLDFPIYIKGTVDRVDRINGQLRIIDYKSGSVKAIDLAVKDIRNIISENKTKALQLLMYSYMYAKQNILKVPVVAGIISLKNLNDQLVIPFTCSKQVLIDNESFSKLEEAIEDLITEICDLHIPFVKNEEVTYY